CNLGDEDTSGVVTLSGQVLDAETNDPVPGAFVRVLPFDLLFEADETGNYDFTVEIDSTMELRVQATADGFSTNSTEVLALAGRQISVPTLRISKLGVEEPESGIASNILLLEQSVESIGVKESGSREVAQVTFQLADSLGRPVILDNQAFVRFRLGVRPNGGEFIYPTEAQTDNTGRVTVNLSSGTRAGVVQIVAEADVNGETIRSLPVSVAIHGGLPDQIHFSIGPERFNFPGLRRYGLENPISVIVGDQFGNPVKPGTAVYFTTDGGIVEGSILTDNQGRGSADLISANPLPGDGIAVITASTADKDQNVVTSRTSVVFSGVPVVGITPSIAALDTEYRMTVTDQNGNPLAGGTVITTRVEGTKVKSVGNTNVRLDDTA
ncbi:MAG: Ig-like domain-containing protein, partial [Rhodothermales bacterium]